MLWVKLQVTTQVSHHRVAKPKNSKNNLNKMFSLKTWEKYTENIHKTYESIIYHAILLDPLGHIFSLKKTYNKLNKITDQHQNFLHGGSFFPKWIVKFFIGEPIILVLVNLLKYVQSEMHKKLKRFYQLPLQYLHFT